MLGGIITNVWEASAIFCVWLEKLALEARHKGAVTDRLKAMSELSHVRLTENREHNARTWLVEHGIPPTAEALASLHQKNGKQHRPRAANWIHFVRSETPKWQNARR